MICEKCGARMKCIDSREDKDRRRVYTCNCGERIYTVEMVCKSKSDKISKSIEGRIECPFYLRMGTGCIECEGLIKNTTILTRFPDDKKKKLYQQAVCSTSGGKKCLLYRAIAKRYESEE